ncbi:MAG TPA: hypothetical protein VIF61_00295 [Methylocystis sp.]|jgi:hypothetical protein
MERIILDVALVLILASFPLHVVLSLLWRAQMAIAADAVLAELRAIAHPLFVVEPLDEDEPDMIAMLGSTYARPPVVSSRDMTREELSELFEDKRAYSEPDPLGR